MKVSPQRLRALTAPGWIVMVAVLLFIGARSWAGGVVTNCTQQALQAALIDGGLVTFSSNCTITLTHHLSITNETTIDAAGHNVIISGGTNAALFRISSQVTLIGLTLSSAKSAQGGSALYVYSNSVVTASNCVFTGNRVTAANGLPGQPGANSSGPEGGDGGNGYPGNTAIGGAIWNAGTLKLIRCTLSHNAAVAGNGGAGGNGGSGSGALAQGGDGGPGGAGGGCYGGAVYNGGNLIVIDCTFTGNSVTGGNGGAGGFGGTNGFAGRTGQGGAGSLGFGAGIYNAQNLWVDRCTFNANRATGGKSADGGTQNGGLGQDGYTGGNAAGGGLFNGSLALLTNSTFFNNVVTGGTGGNGGPGTGTLSTGGRGGNGGDAMGGGVENYSGALTLVNCTLSKCSAFGGTNGIAGPGPFPNENGRLGRALGGNIANMTGSSVLRNSLIVLAQFGGCGYGSFIDQGYNMTSDTSIALDGQSFENILNPKIGTFGMHGGPTATIPLVAGSPALNRILLELAPPIDQRGVPRNDVAADIGAFELNTNPIMISVSGHVLQGTNGVADVTILATISSIINTTTTGPDGAYSFQFPAGSTVLLTPYLTNYVFDPPDLTLDLATNVTDADFEGTPVGPSTVQVSGHVLEGTNALLGVKITSGTNQTTTGPDGAYTLTLPQGPAVLTPSLTNYSFVPTQLSLNLVTNVTSADFQGAPVLRITSPTNSQVQISAAGMPGQSYSVETSTNLTHWTAVSTSAPPALVIDPTTNSIKFYRLRRL